MIRVKYPRTKHLPFSPGRGSDDKVHTNLDFFIGKEVVITEKLDGECSTLYPDYYSHARSIDSNNHPSRDWLKSFHGGIAHKMGIGTRICGENVYAKHSIAYTELESYFYGFSLWGDDGWCFSWDITVAHFEEIGIIPVPVIWRGIFNETKLIQLSSSLQLDQEGFVMRLANGFWYDQFEERVAKYVRAGHIQSDDHWQHQPVIPNHLSNRNTDV